ncbi:WD_0702 family putative metalloprotease [Wolbachia endosymbiont of Pentidionis agamae]|uniref:WD_0702 family putative metalloprotease n=1 Tax=Wolbachia endosymbiont of Pentidionis agamae TaxID=3110435 RepID=UPI002FD76ED1
MLLRKLLKCGIKTKGAESIIQYVEYLYKFLKFRNILNLTLSLIKQNRLSFEVKPLMTAGGLCQTNRSANLNTYIIMIRKINPYIIIHELAHMIEEELDLNLEHKFFPNIQQDIQQNLKQSNILVQNIINQVIFTEIKSYGDTKSRISELFARYFELFAWAQEVYPKDRDYLIRTQDLNKIFFNANKWKENDLDVKINRIIDKEIQSYSSTVPIIDINKIPSKWGDKTSYKKKIGSIFDSSN